jgi:hypothetical protein
VRRSTSQNRHRKEKHRDRREVSIASTIFLALMPHSSDLAWKKNAEGIRTREQEHDRNNEKRTAKKRVVGATTRGSNSIKFALQVEGKKDRGRKKER